MQRSLPTLVVGLGAALLLTACSPSLTSQAKAHEPSSGRTAEHHRHKHHRQQHHPGSSAPSGAVTAAPTPSASPTTPPPTHFSVWTVGAHPLPLRPDGYGQIEPTPAQLRVRIMRTTDLLPPPTDGRFHVTVSSISLSQAHAMDLAWQPRCPVPLADLRYLTMTFVGFDGLPHTGAMVVNKSVVSDVVTVFHKLYDARFPLEQMTPATNAGLQAPPTGDGNETSAYACRPATGQTSGWSAHAYGLAVDVNPFQNPYSKGDLVIPELASAYLDRSWQRPGMIYPDGVVVKAFESVGWTWGGTFHSLKDLHHFSANGE